MIGVSVAPDHGAFRVFHIMMARQPLDRVKSPGLGRNSMNKTWQDMNADEKIDDLSRHLNALALRLEGVEQKLKEIDDKAANEKLAAPDPQGFG
jgi:hypothetical protein